MKKIIIIVMILLLIPIYVFAQSARNASVSTMSHSRTNVSNIGATGLDVAGNPGYLALTGSVQDGAVYLPEYYLWVDIDGDLCMASHSTLTNYSSFPNGDWSTTMEQACTKVGGQS